MERAREIDFSSTDARLASAKGLWRQQRYLWRRSSENKEEEVALCHCDMRELEQGVQRWVRKCSLFYFSLLFFEPVIDRLFNINLPDLHKSCLKNNGTRPGCYLTATG